jgi:protein involved in polysaccharide export with SLBB domain
MARIYLSYNSRDRELAQEFSNGLKELGHQIAIDVDMLNVGDSWRQKLQNGLKSSDGVIVLLTENSLTSQFVMSEIGKPAAYHM